MDKQSLELLAMGIDPIEANLMHVKQVRIDQNSV